MGLFSTKKIIRVASTVYNMAGEEANRPDFLKSTMFASTINPNSGYLGERIVQSYLSGPGMNQRLLFNYAVRNNYPGLLKYSTSKVLITDTEVVRPYISIPGSPAGMELIIRNVSVSKGDYQVFADDYMLNNLPAEFNSSWVAEYNHNDHIITIQREGGGVVTFSAGIYNSRSKYVIANYYFTLSSQTEPEGGSKIFIYEIGTGNTVLDALDEESESEVVGEFFPIIPIRLNNVSITDPVYENLYNSSKTLYKKATKRQKLEELIAEVEANEDLEEIDYAYIQWAISLNTKDKRAMQYIYSFWKNLIPLSGISSDYINVFLDSIEVYGTAQATIDAWVTAQSNPADPLYGTTRPTAVSFNEPQIVTLKFKTDHSELQDFDNRISFSLITEDEFEGIGKEGAVKGDLWTVKESPHTWSVITTQHSNGSDTHEETNTMSVWRIYWQTDVNQYKRITVYGGIFENYIYGGKAVRITTDEAFDDIDESGFLLPLHMPSLKDAGLASATQLTVANTYIVFNSYEVFKKKWYQTFFGMLFAIIIIIVAAALIAPNIIGSISGVFGMNATLGASFGLTGTASIVAGAVANALAAVAMSMALTVASTAIFGEKWGALIGSLLSFVISFGIADGFGNLATMFQPSNILALSSALANGYQGFVQGSISEMNMELFEIGENYEKEMDRIQELINKLIGNDLAFDPMSLTDVSKGNGSRTGNYLPESLDDFIQRTTLTGSDIVDMTLSIINDFADLSLTLPRT